MTVLVTGGAGYIGSHMVHELVDAGEQVVVLDDLSTGSRAALPAAGGAAGEARLFVGDCGDVGLVEALIGSFEVTAIVHFAGSIVVADSVRDPLAYYRNNTMNTRALIEAAVRRGVRRFILSSTAAVYGNPEAVPVPEDAPTRPISPYGTSTLMSEIMLHDVGAAHDLNYVILRYFNVAGADPQLRTGLVGRNATHLLKVAVETALGARPRMEVFGTRYPTPDGTCVRDFIHVSDLARAHMAALGYLRQGGQSATFNCGYGRGYSVLEVIEAVKRACGHSFPVRFSEPRPGDAVAVVADVRRLRATLGLAPRFDDLDTIAAHAIAWERRLMERRQAEARRAVPA
jgi:UDP-glucose 4-epimerase